MTNQDLNIEISTFQKVAESEMEQLHKEIFSLKVIITQLYAEIEKLSKDAVKEERTITEEKYL